MREALAVVARAPRAGEVKTRLTGALGAEAAAGLYRAFLRDTAEMVAEVRGARPSVECVVCYTPPDGERDVRALFEADTAGLAQRGEALGERLANLFEDLFRAGFDAVAAIGADSPTLPAAYVVAAFEALERGAHAVIGPADDGGYYLLGLKRPCRELFERVELSAARTFDDTVRVARESGLTVQVLAGWFDVDTTVDLERLRAELECDARGARHTRLFLATGIDKAG